MAVYFIQVSGGGAVKIGYSEAPERRLRELMAWSPAVLEIMAQMPGSLATEAFFHGRFADYRMHFEWFRPAFPVVEAIEIINNTGTYPGLPPLFGGGRSEVGKWMGEADLRQKLGASRKELAEAAGVTVSAVSGWNSGVPVRHHGMIARFAASRGIHMSEIDFMAERT